MKRADYPAVYLGRSLAPIYVQLSTIFRRLIENGEWSVDHQVPTHEQLAAQFGVNPTTVRKAIAMLVREGLLKTYRKRGTFVITKPARQEWYDIPTSWNDAIMAQRGLVIEPLSSARASEAPHLPDGGREAPSYHLLRRLFWRGDEPLCLEVAFLDGRLVKKIGARRLQLTPILQFLDGLGEASTLRADETLTFGIADRATAANLRLPLNAPIAILHQTVLDPEATLVFDAKAYFRGDCIRVFEQIKP